MNRLTLGLLGWLTLTLAFNRPIAAQRYELVKSFAAVEAHQAAAADPRHFYAITNDLVGKYDRQTGERLVTSTGSAQHLNSGFIWDEKLYLAHSNYPKQPEQSEIKVLDSRSMALTTFKDFGNYGGSLTWAVHHEQSWFCNFARYGDDNGNTFLVQFDSQWREQDRWTYPPEVIGKLGRFSISGAAWNEDAWLVTGHDDRVVFKLRFPTAGGKVLSYIETLPVPFTGQGIALDPSTQGLVGIDRGQRLVIFAKLNRAAASLGEQRVQP